MQYLKKFITLEEYNNYKNSGKMLLPNVSYISEEDSVMFNPYIEVANVGDIAYWDGSKVITIAKDKYNTSLGTAVGVVVIPNNFLPDGRARIVAIGQENEYKYWENNSEYLDTSLPNLNSVPITDNLGSSTYNSCTWGYIPSDLFDGEMSYIDNKSYYSEDAIMDGMLIQSIYTNDDKFNTIYTTLSDENALADFDGKGNTDVIVALGSDYEAACHARNYTDGASNLEYYLPSIGELGVMFARLKTINNSIESVGGAIVPIDEQIWSSSENGRSLAWRLLALDGNVEKSYKDDCYYVRSFALL